MTTPRILVLKADDRRALAAYCRRQVAWLPAGSARLVVSGGSVGIFTTPPWDVMVFAAVPLAEPIAGVVDEYVSLVALADVLEADAPVNIDDLPRAPVSASKGITLLDLPPREGWQVPMNGLSGDLAAKVAEGLAAVQQRTAVFGPRDTDLEVRRWWAEPGWSGLSMGVLFAAYQLGMLPNDRSRVSASTCGPWKRFSTSRGQVFSFGTGTPDAASLALLYPEGRA